MIISITYNIIMNWNVFLFIIEFFILILGPALWFGSGFIDPEDPKSKRREFVRKVGVTITTVIVGIIVIGVIAEIEEVIFTNDHS